MKYDFEGFGSIALSKTEVKCNFTGNFERILINHPPNDNFLRDNSLQKLRTSISKKKAVGVSEMEHREISTFCMSVTMKLTTQALENEPVKKFRTCGAAKFIPSAISKGSEEEK